MQSFCRFHVSPRATINQPTNHMNHIEVAIRLVRACGPVSKQEIAEEILTHAVGADRKNCEHLAQVAIDHGFETGWITNYEEDDCYVIA